jgi:hypothetical protein
MLTSLAKRARRYSRATATLRSVFQERPAMARYSLRVLDDVAAQGEGARREPSGTRLFGEELSGP